jgi:hypothetical protein
MRGLHHFDLQLLFQRKSKKALRRCQDSLDQLWIDAMARQNQIEETATVKHVPKIGEEGSAHLRWTVKAGEINLNPAVALADYGSRS